MYIVNHGKLDVYIDDKRIAGLEDGAVFGEISLLEVAGGNRRTADVSLFENRMVSMRTSHRLGHFTRFLHTLQSAQGRFERSVERFS